MNNFLDGEKNHNQYLSPTEMNCLGIHVIYFYPSTSLIISCFHLNRESFAQILVQSSNRETERGCAYYCC